MIICYYKRCVRNLVFYVCLGLFSCEHSTTEVPHEHVNSSLEGSDLVFLESAKYEFWSKYRLEMSDHQEIFSEVLSQDVHAPFSVLFGSWEVFKVY